jgi:hypothetical protein
VTRTLFGPHGMISRSGPRMTMEVELTPVVGIVLLHRITSGSPFRVRRGFFAIDGEIIEKVPQRNF